MSVHSGAHLSRDGDVDVVVVPGPVPRPELGGYNGCLGEQEATSSVCCPSSLVTFLQPCERLNIKKTLIRLVKAMKHFNES